LPRVSSSRRRRPPGSPLFPYTTLFRSKSGAVSMTTARPSNSSSTEGRVRLSRGSEDVHTGQRQAKVGTPVEVPVPRKVNLISSRSEEHTSELQSRVDLVCRLLLEQKNT